MSKWRFITVLQRLWCEIQIRILYFTSLWGTRFFTFLTTIISTFFSIPTIVLEQLNSLELFLKFEIYKLGRKNCVYPPWHIIIYNFRISYQFFHINGVVFCLGSNTERQTRVTIVNQVIVYTFSSFRRRRMVGNPACLRV